MTELRNVLAHQSSILNEKDEKIGFYHFDQKSDHTMIVTQAKTKEEWDKYFVEYENLIRDFISKIDEILNLIKENKK